MLQRCNDPELCTSLAGLEDQLSGLAGLDGRGRANTLTAEDRGDTLTEEPDPPPAPDLDTLCDSLDALCEERVAVTDEAIRQVESLLKKVETCESLFPSSSHLTDAEKAGSNYAAWRQQEFQVRVKILCMWFNITVQLHQKVEQLRHILVGEGTGAGAGWPVLDTATAAPAPVTPPVTPNLSAEDRKGTPEQIKPSKAVKFQVSEDLASTSSPSDSNNSTDSGPPGLKMGPTRR